MKYTTFDRICAPFLQIPALFAPWEHAAGKRSKATILQNTRTR